MQLRGRQEFRLSDFWVGLYLLVGVLGKGGVRFAGVVRAAGGSLRTVGGAGRAARWVPEFDADATLGRLRWGLVGSAWLDCGLRSRALRVVRRYEVVGLGWTSVRVSPRNKLWESKETSHSL